MNEIPKLSQRQLVCLTRIAQGETSVEIALALSLSRRTVDHYVGYACAKLGARNRAQAVATAIRLELIRPTDAIGPAPSR